MRELLTAKARWENEKASVEKVSKLREEIESVNSEIQIAQRNYDLNKAAELQYGRLPELKKQLEEEEERVAKEDRSMVRESVTEDEIAKIISRWTGIPVAKLTESERNKTLHLDKILHERVVGQDEAVELGIGGGERERRGWFEQMFCGARPLAEVHRADDHRGFVRAACRLL